MSSSPLSVTLPPPDAETLLPPPHAEWISGIPSYDGNFEDWTFKFSMQYLNHLLRPVYSDEKIRSEVITRNIHIWRRAFTHITFSADCYEALELYGDACWHLAFLSYLYHIFPDLTEAAASNLNGYYMSKIFQSQLATKLKMHQWALVGAATIATRDICEDLLESFLAALYTSAQNLHDIYVNELHDYKTAALHAVTGFEAVLKMVHYIFDGEKIDESRMQGSAKSILFSLGTLIGVRKGGSVVEVKSMRPLVMAEIAPTTATSSSATTVPASSTPNVVCCHWHYVAPKLLVDRIREQFGINLPTYLCHPRPDKTVAADEALETVRRAGLTDAVLSEIRTVAHGVNRLPPQLAASVLAKFQQEHQSRKIYFMIPTSTRDPQTGSFSLVLMGSTSDDRPIRLASISVVKSRGGSGDSSNSGIKSHQPYVQCAQEYLRSPPSLR